MLRIKFAAALVAGLLGSASGRAERIDAAPVDFDRDVRPILSDRCSQCHGPDPETRQADLRLDQQESAFEDRDGRPAFRPGDVEHSEALRRIFSEDPDEQMPPSDSKLELSTAEKEILRRWVDEGAPWTDHWAFAAPVKPELPTVNAADWPRQPLDHFVLARLERAGQRPSPPARAAKLLRRVTLDLTGLPPTLGELDEFLADPSDAAYERAVDRLLESPRYGERMAWDWLDAARYADTDGFQGDPSRTMWPWRDWLIRALNDNVPFDQFTVQMLAGDLLPDATPEQIVATGFNRNHMHNGEGGRIAEETRVENAFDRTETTATVWLGLTMTCARCHDHKFDPVTQREYYQFYAYFNNNAGDGGRSAGQHAPVLEYRGPAERAQVAQLDREIADLNATINAPSAEDDAAQSTWEQQLRERLQQGELQGQVSLGPWSALGTLPAPDGDGAKAFDHNYGPETEVNLNDPATPADVAWRAAPEFADGQVHPLPAEVGVTYLYRTLDAPTARALDVSLGSDDAIKVWLNGEQVLAKNVKRGAEADQEQVQLRLDQGENQLLLKIVNTGGIGGFYFRSLGESLHGFPAEIETIVLASPAVRTPEQRSTLRAFYRERYSETSKQLNEQLAKVQQKRNSIPAIPVMVMDELPADRRRETRILARGAYDQPLEPVAPATPSFLPSPAEGSPANRLTLAQWLLDPANPLTARVIVNRYWQLFFDSGLVSTSEDFGRQGSRPTHPELLDWLAVHFRESGWNVKALHKQIVTSAAYRQSSNFWQPGDVDRADSSAAQSTDPGNRLLGRAARHRLPSWMLRDQALALSGLLVERLGGPPVKPYQPPGVWAEATFGKIRYAQDQGEALYRRSLYAFWRRIVGPTMFFDSAKRQTCEVKPTRTNTPLHALTTLNETLFVEAARGLAARVLLEAPDESTEQRIARAFRMTTARRPQPLELDLLHRRWQALYDEFKEHPEEAELLLSVGESPRVAELDAAEHAAYAAVCSLLLNLDEVLSKE
ncbi:PSD1 and planctomycete cytochrome C domain-containing protein [Pirellulales bacterium]|nr:PSD1 and planctomycete cytochrome C domain-containing protein [Pirellulales bacterium]